MGEQDIGYGHLRVGGELKGCVWSRVCNLFVWGMSMEQGRGVFLAC